ncbi:pyruvate dehydrogenase (acetyl-transferring) E1 component subunit alpha [Halosimplex rubrum]|uniref:pyruvate dehydrogenase (acetyl-transferring) E1 component subunit alpha n=1 Tax=Halosimplex rubrum TaxID=869889 RepID=UPI001FE26428|nr:pyruvate dehydrogenase (acetyl-transferring) E1 component subunit alpha [Halosimplex rubrum]
MRLLGLGSRVSDSERVARTDDGLAQVLDADGRVREGATVPDLPDEELVAMFREMTLARHLDERAVSLQRQGRMGTYPPLAGQEAAQVASTHALRDDDWIVDQYREHGAVAVRGLEPEYLLYWMGHEVGNEWLASKHVFPLNISIASHLPHATGMAWAARLQGDDRIVCCHFGDGATSEGDFHEALNFAGVFDAPALFFCNNNQYAISVPRERQTASATIAAKADAYGFAGLRVDGMDPLAVYQVTKGAVEKARDPGADQLRPTLIEAEMYRFGAHTTADDPSRYRTDEEVARWRDRDPIPRMETFLRERGLLDDERVAAIEERNRDAVAALVEAAEAYEPDVSEWFAHAYAEPTARVRESEAYLRALRERHGDDALLRDE